MSTVVSGGSRSTATTARTASSTSPSTTECAGRRPRSRSAARTSSTPRTTRTPATAATLRWTRRCSASWRMIATGPTGKCHAPHSPHALRRVCPSTLHGSHFRPIRGPPGRTACRRCGTAKVHRPRPRWEPCAPRDPDTMKNPDGSPVLDPNGQPVDERVTHTWAVQCSRKVLTTGIDSPAGDCVQTRTVNEPLINPLRLDHGKLTIQRNGTFVYEPDPGWRGTDTFSYLPTLAGAPAAVGGPTWGNASLTVRDRPPPSQTHAFDDTVTGTEDTPLSISPFELRANDQFADAHQVRLRALHEPHPGGLVPDPARQDQSLLLRWERTAGRLRDHLHTRPELPRPGLVRLHRGGHRGHRRCPGTRAARRHGGRRSPGSERGLRQHEAEAGGHDQPARQRHRRRQHDRPVGDREDQRRRGRAVPVRSASGS